MLLLLHFLGFFALLSYEKVNTEQQQKLFVVLHPRSATLDFSLDVSSQDPGRDC